MDFYKHVHKGNGLDNAATKRSFAVLKSEFFCLYKSPPYQN